MENYGVSKRVIKNDEMFCQGLEKLNFDLRNDILNQRINVKKRDIQKLASLEIAKGSICNLESLMSLVN